VPSRAIRSVLESMPGSVLGSVLRAYLRAYVSRLGVCHREQLGANSQAGWECAIECNQVCTWERAMKCIWQLAFKFVVCSVMYSIQRTTSHAYHSNLVNM